VQALKSAINKLRNAAIELGELNLQCLPTQMRT
jgi:hypothetical protein